MELAKSAQAPVLSLPPEIPVIEELRRAPIKAIQPTGEEVEVAAVITPSAPNRVVATVVKAPGNLGAAPVVGLAGLIGLAAGISLTLIRKRFTLMEKRIQWAQYCRKFL
jgi:hypothetical protein